VEHWFQAQKFEDAAYRERVRGARSPKQAAELGRSRAFALRAGWDEARDEVMYRGVRKKFETHPTLRELLPGTGDEELVEDAPGDYYWGRGRDGTGQNKLGQVLMRVRSGLAKGLSRGDDRYALSQRAAQARLSPDGRTMSRSKRSAAAVAPSGVSVNRAGPQSTSRRSPSPTATSAGCSQLIGT
jgi:ribA/ribD-fused uncharacterized protein